MARRIVTLESIIEDMERGLFHATFHGGTREFNVREYMQKVFAEYSRNLRTRLRRIASETADAAIASGMACTMGSLGILSSTLRHHYHYYRLDTWKDICEFHLNILIAVLTNLFPQHDFSMRIARLRARIMLQSEILYQE